MYPFLSAQVLLLQQLWLLQSLPKLYIDIAPASNINTVSNINARHTSVADDTCDQGWKVSSEESDG